MVFRRFSLRLAMRLIVLGIAIAAALWLILQPGLHSATLLADESVLQRSANPNSPMMAGLSAAAGRPRMSRWA